jgi:ABC-type transporter Mla subunit MlaD
MAIVAILDRLDYLEAHHDPAHARAMADAVADRLFVEGERDAALHDLAIARDHLEAANNAHMEAEKDCTNATRMLDEAVSRADRNEKARRDAVALWTKQAETCRQLAGALESVISVAIDCQSRWSRGHELIINSAKSVLKQVQP